MRRLLWLFIRVVCTAGFLSACTEPHRTCVMTPNPDSLQRRNATGDTSIIAPLDTKCCDAPCLAMYR